jgi:hypothetical protein
MGIGPELTLEQLAAHVADALEAAGITAVLTGGAVVSIYTHNAFESFDLDFVTAAGRRELTNAMTALGFTRDVGRHFRHPRTRFTVEFPGGPLMVGNEPVRRHARRRLPEGTIRLLTPTDAVKDRLAAFYHWSDRQALAQAVAIARAQPVTLSEVRRWSIAEGRLDGFEIFRTRLKTS